LLTPSHSIHFLNFADTIIEHHLKLLDLPGHWRLMPVILTAQEGGIRRILKPTLRRWFWRSCLENIQDKMRWWSGSSSQVLA
jgi:hypothetical protein